MIRTCTLIAIWTYTLIMIRTYTLKVITIGYANYGMNDTVTITVLVREEGLRSEKSASFYQTTRRFIQKDINFQSLPCEWTSDEANRNL
jgi:hypothetical protein